MLNAPLALLLCVPAFAGDLVERPFLPVKSGPPAAQVDWTALELHVTARSDRSFGAWKDRRMQEQDALDALGPKVRELATGLRVTPDHRVQDLLTGDPKLASRLEDGLQSWKVSETRYHTGGGVEMSAKLDLHAWLRPALASIATQVETTGEPGDATGVVIDARGQALTLPLAPRVQAADGRVLIDLSLISAEVVQTQAPVRYVTDPADPAAWKRAGDAPLFARATDTSGGAWVLAEGAPLATDPRLAPLVAQGRIVVVVDEP
jgi:hypothetical protein